MPNAKLAQEMYDFYHAALDNRLLEQGANNPDAYELADELAMQDTLEKFNCTWDQVCDMLELED